MSDNESNRSTSKPEMSTGILDLSSMFHRLWHIDKDNVTHRIISFLKTIKEQEVIIAVDCPPYKRKDISPDYKANRDVPDPELIQCLKYTKNECYKNGFRIAMAEGWEADDVIATIIEEMIEKEDAGQIIVYGSDKDLLQCIPITDVFSGEIQDAQSRLGVETGQVVDYLALIGDTSDNIKGVRGVGPKTAVSLLEKFSSIDGIYKAIDDGAEGFRPAILSALNDSREHIDKSIELIQLNFSAHIEYLQKEVEEEADIMGPTNEEAVEIIPETVEVESKDKIAISHEVVEYKKSLEPMTMNQALSVAKMFDKSGLYPKFRGPEQVMMTIMRGRELGIGATSALELIDMIQGKPTMKAAGLLAIVLSRRDVCEYLYCTEMNAKRATWTTKRFGNPKEISRTFTIEDAAKMKLSTKDNWIKQPDVMLQWRACSQLIRQVYPDLINGLYAIEELEN